MKKKPVKKLKKPAKRHKKVEVFWLVDFNISESKIIIESQDEVLEHIKNNVLGVLRTDEEIEITFGKTTMTQKQLMKLPDID